MNDYSKYRTYFGVVKIMFIAAVLLGSAITIGSLSVLAAAKTRNEEGQTIVWEANSTHYVTGKFKVEEGDTMIIEPGVTIKFTYAGAMEGNPHTFRVYGKLIARGTADNPILFTSNSTNPAPYDWDKVKFHKQADPTSIMEHCIIEYSTQGVQPDRCDVTIKNCTMRNIGKYGVKVVKSSPFISGCYISVRNIGVRVGGGEPNPHPTIVDNIFDGCDFYGILADSSSETIILNNTFKNSGEYGIYSTNADPTIEGNIFQGDKIGIAFVNSQGHIGNNNISSSKENGIFMRYSYNVSIEENVISNNAVGIYAENTIGTITNNIFEGIQAASIEMVDCDIEQNNNVYGGIITSEKHIVFQAVNRDGYPIKGTTITVKDAFGTEVTSKSLGDKSTILLGLDYLEVDSSGKVKSFVPYTITVSKDGQSTDNEVSQFTNPLVQVKLDKSSTPELKITSQDKSDDIVTIKGSVDYGEIDTSEMDHEVMVKVGDGDWIEAVGKTRWVYAASSSEMDDGDKVQVKLSDGIKDPSISEIVEVEKTDAEYVIVIIVCICIVIMIIVLILIKSRKPNASTSEKEKDEDKEE